MSYAQPWDVALPGMPTPPPASDETDSGRGVVSDPSLAPNDDDVERFRRKIVRSPTCWFWVGGISRPDGYGRFTFQRDNVQRTVLAHRFALLAEGYDLSHGAVAEHECNEPLCVRVGTGHVRVSTQSDNLRYAVQHGRHDGNRPASMSTYRAERSLRIRAAIKGGWNARAFRAAISAPVENQLPLFP